MDVFSFLAEYGLIPGGSVLALALIWYFRGFLHKGLSKFIATHRRKYPLGYHTFFLRMQNWMRYDVAHISFHDEFRREVFTDFLLIKMGTAATDMKKLVDNEKLWANLHPNELKDIIITEIMSIVSSYEDKCKAEGIPELVIQKFNKWHETRVKFTVAGVKSVCSSQFYKDNRARMAAVLDILTVAFHDTILDAERTLNSLNGELNNLKYKGYVCCDATDGPGNQDN